MGRTRAACSLRPGTVRARSRRRREIRRQRRRGRGPRRRRLRREPAARAGLVEPVHRRARVRRGDAEGRPEDGPAVQVPRLGCPRLLGLDERADPPGPEPRDRRHDRPGGVEPRRDPGLRALERRSGRRRRRGRAAHRDERAAAEKERGGGDGARCPGSPHAWMMRATAGASTVRLGWGLPRASHTRRCVAAPRPPAPAGFRRRSAARRRPLRFRAPRGLKGIPASCERLWLTRSTRRPRFRRSVCHSVLSSRR